MCHDAADGEGFESLQELPDATLWKDALLQSIYQTHFVLVKAFLRGRREIGEKIFWRRWWFALTPCPSPDAAGKGCLQTSSLALNPTLT